MSTHVSKVDSEMKVGKFAGRYYRPELLRCDERAAMDLKMKERSIKFDMDGVIG